MERRVEMPLGVVVERRKSSHRWQDWVWQPVSVLVGAPPLGAEWRQLLQGDGWTRYHAANLPLELHRGETEAYLINLAQRPPRVYVVLRPAAGPGPGPFQPALITASPVEALSYQTSGEEIVEGVPMPEPVIAWLEAFVARHHVEQPFVKRKRGKGATAGGEGRARAGRAPVASGTDEHG